MSKTKVIIFAMLLWIYNVLTAIDQLAAALLGFDPDETISSVAEKNKNDYWLAYKISQFLEAVDPGHGSDSVELDEGKHSVWGYLKRNLTSGD